MLQSFFQWNVRHKKQVIRVFKFFYIIIFLNLIYAAYHIAQGTNSIVLYEIALLSGKTALVFFCITITPGILRRFGIRGIIPSLIMLYRRHFGISTFSFSFYHYAVMGLFPTTIGGLPLILPFPMFQFAGILALYTMAILFFTSNDWSIRNLGPWWGRIHTLIYIIAWGIFFHVFLQRISTWSVLIGIYAALETASLIYFYILRKPTLPTPPPQASQSAPTPPATSETTQTNA